MRYKWPIIIVLAIVLIALLMYSQKPLAVYFETGDTVHFDKQNPYPFSIGIDMETGFERLEIVVEKASYSKKVFSGDFWKSGFATCDFFECWCNADRSILIGSSAGIEKCCVKNGWQGIDVSGEAKCFKTVDDIPVWIRLKHGQEIVWEFNPLVDSLPQRIDISSYVNVNCARELANVQKGLFGELNTYCIIDFVFESQKSSGVLTLNFGEITGDVQTCFDGVQNLDEIAVDFGGVCGTDLCLLRGTECNAHCSGFDWITGQCNPVSGDCVWTTEENSLKCGFTDEDIVEDDDTDGEVEPSKNYFVENPFISVLLGILIILGGVAFYVYVKNR